METTLTPSVVYAREALLSYRPGGRKLGGTINDSRSAAAHVRHAIGEPMVEHFVAVAMDSRNRTLGWSTIGVGSLAACPVDLCQLARFAVLSGARGLVLGHNHPSGDPAPSGDDIAITERAISALRLLGVQVLDHVIVADGSDGFFSFLDAGILFPKGR